MPSSDETSGPPRLVTYARTRLLDREAAVDLATLTTGTCLGGFARHLAGRSVLVATQAQLGSAVAFVELDGAARRLIIAPPDLRPELLDAVIADAEIDAVVTDRPELFAGRGLAAVVPLTLPIAGAPEPLDRGFDTEWVLLTSGTSGRPKMVVHTLAALTGAIAAAPNSAADMVWATFYDIRRYGGLQMFLRAILGGTDFVLSAHGEPIGAHLRRLGAAGVTHISGTPSHWRGVLMSHDRDLLQPSYVRLSGEIADQVVLDGLRAAYPKAAIGHAYASTEAGVGFAVDDGQEGFPVSFLGAATDAPTAAAELRVVDGSLRIRSSRRATRYVGADMPALADDDGFVETGDLVERRGDRYVFVGRRGGIINVGGLKVNPEEVEAAINSHAEVRMSLVQARRNPLTGAIVTADIVLRDPQAGSDDLKSEILAGCRSRLERHKVPVIIRFVASIALTAGGKLDRSPAR